MKRLKRQHETDREEAMTILENFKREVTARERQVKAGYQEKWVPVDAIVNRCPY